jgi:hypothetical protein
MYTAKTSGKARAVLSGSPTLPGAPLSRAGEAVEETAV